MEGNVLNRRFAAWDRDDSARHGRIKRKVSQNVPAALLVVSSPHALLLDDKSLWVGISCRANHRCKVAIRSDDRTIT
jgi:hypothetical protein